MLVDVDEHAVGDDFVRNRVAQCSGVAAEFAASDEFVGRSVDGHVVNRLKALVGDDHGGLGGFLVVERGAMITPNGWVLEGDLDLFAEGREGPSSSWGFNRDRRGGVFSDDKRVRGHSCSFGQWGMDTVAVGGVLIPMSILWRVVPRCQEKYVQICIK